MGHKVMLYGESQGLWADGSKSAQPFDSQGNSSLNKGNRSGFVGTGAPGH